MSTNAENDTPSLDRELMLELFGDDGSEDGETSSDSSTTDSSISNADEVIEQNECKNTNMESMMGELNLEGFEMDVLPHVHVLISPRSFSDFEILIGLDQITSPPPVYRVSGSPASPTTPSFIGFSTTASFNDHTSYEEDYMDVDDPHLYQAAWGTIAQNVNTISQRSDYPRKRSRRSQRGFGSPFTFSWNKIRRSKVSSSPYPIPGKGQRLGRHDPRKRVSALTFFHWPTF
ncbi:hypothetical protein Clacol_003516 [Clathrus columnatus]|uniref:Uncharacterized protein n=1 Tax=Clathrus columnatus TaxID=1419009 RepID=A0AAV5A971_9AGAM|nr:hypothetical protein Clacol_003516 [Clathrus columnatus]